MQVAATPPKRASRTSLRQSSRIDRQGIRLGIKLAHVCVLLAALTVWTNRGLNIGIQVLSPNQAFSVLSFFFLLPSVAQGAVVLDRFSRREYITVALATVGMLFAIGLSYTYAESPIDVARFVGRYVYGLLLLTATIYVARFYPKIAQHMVACFIVGGAAVSLFCLAGHFNGTIGRLVFQDMWAKRAFGFYNNPNQLAMVLVGAIVLAFWPKLFSLILRLPLIACLVLGVLLTGSKFNMGLVLVIVPLLLIWLPAREGKIAQASASIFFGIPIVALGAMASAILIRASSADYYNRMVAVVNDPTGAETTTSRIDLWHMAFACWKEHPFTGIGAGNAAMCLPFPHAHNVFINYLLETGLIGSVAFLVFLTVIFKIGNRVSRLARDTTDGGRDRPALYRSSALGTVAMYAFVMSNCSSDSMGPATMPALFMYVAIIMALIQPIRDEARLRSRQTRT